MKTYLLITPRTATRVNVYVSNIFAGFTTFPLVAFVLTLPYMVFEYRRYGSIPFSRTAIVYTFLLYCICAYYMIILPLPARDAVASYASDPQLAPFHFIVAFLGETSAQLTDPSTWHYALGDPFILGAFFNVLLLAPLGFYLRYYFERRWYQALVIGFGVSLFFELTQLSGLYGWYAHPYRLFDVDDLITNTLGCMVGFWLAGPIGRVLPTRDEIDAKAYANSDYASATHRFTAALIDWLCTLPLFAVAAAVVVIPNAGLIGSTGIDATIGALDEALRATAGFGLPEYAIGVYVLAVVIFFMVVPCIAHGRTLGQKALKLRIVARRGGPARWWQCCLRNGLLYFVFIPAPIILTGVVALLPDADVSAASVLMIALLAIVLFVALLVRLVRSALGHPLLLLNGLFSATRVVSDRGCGEHGVEGLGLRRRLREKVARRRADDGRQGE